MKKQKITIGIPSDFAYGMIPEINTEKYTEFMKESVENNGGSIFFGGDIYDDTEEYVSPEMQENINKCVGGIPYHTLSDNDFRMLEAQATQHDIINLPHVGNEPQSKWQEPSTNTVVIEHLKK